MNFYTDYIKPILDYCLALLLFVIAFPFILLLAFFLFFINKGNVFFIHERAGRNGKRFYLFKFKTLKDIYDAQGNLLPDAQRQYYFGNVLRHLHLDELPQLLNILTGDLSLVGPRPLLVSYLPLYNARQKTRHSVKPGIIGLAQVLGGNTLSWNQRLRLDVMYVKKCSWQLDLRILILAASYFLKKTKGHSQSSLFSESFADYCNRQVT